MKIHHISPVILSTLPLIVANSIPSSSTLSKVVDVGYAKYQGTFVQDKVTGSTNTQFLGIRFAAPPIGNLRFNAPVAPSSTPGVQVANTQPPFCLQAGPFGFSATSPFSQNSTRFPPSSTAPGSSLDATPNVSEDCLFLNVVTPGKLGEKKNLPVVVWIYGGGYTVGSAFDSTFGTLYDGNDLIRASGGDVVTVLIQYRLGLFGFLPGQKVKEGGALNAALLDQQFAFQWVQKHISKFGGDPSKVTIWGESAGAGSVLQHIVANGGNTNPPLFNAAITSSTFLPPQYQYNDRIPETIYRQVVDLANCTSTSDTLTCLRQTDVSKLQAANQAVLNNGFFGTFTFVPVVDGDFIKDRPSKLIKEGKVNENALYSVTNSFEGNLFVDQTQASTLQVSDYVSQLFPTLQPSQISAVVRRYASLGTNITQAELIMGESIFLCPTYNLLNTFQRKAFKARFAVPPALHGSDLAYYFNGAEVPENANPDVTQIFSQSFMNFVKHLNPSAQDIPSNISLSGWKPWNGNNELLFNQTSIQVPDVKTFNTSTGLLRRCQFWSSISDATGQ